ncbi:MAG: VWA domain-containing protein [Vicinamibacterales bacterium]
MTRLFSTILVIAVVAAVAPLAQQQPTFRVARELVSIDVVVRDRMGNIVRGLTAADFDVREDGKPQDVETFSFQDVNATSVLARDTNLLQGAEAAVGGAAASPASAATAPAASQTDLTPDALVGRRLVLLLFDVSSMEPEDVQRAVDSAAKYVNEQMGPEDLVSVATVGSTLDVLTDFTGNREEVAAALAALGASEGTATAAASAGTLETDESAATAADSATETSEFDSFNNDARLRALKAVADALAPLQQKKAVIYFSAGMERSGQDNQVELRAATNAAVRANMSIYAVDTRGLQAIAPGGDASQASRGGVGLFSGRNVSQQFSRLASSQDTLVSLAADTGGRSFTDSNDFAAVFAQVRRDISGYYLLGYSSTNTTQDGRFRRVQVRLRRGDLRVEARNGYYAERDFAHTARGDRETQLRTELEAAVSATDVPVLVGTGWFRLDTDRYYVPIAVAVPGGAVPVGTDGEAIVDIMGQVRDEQGRPISRIRETMKIPGAGAQSLAGKQVLYQSGVTLPPGRFSVKVVVRENATGTIGSFEAPVVVPELKQAALKVSSVVLSTQLLPWTRGRTDNPLVRDGVQLLPNLTRVVGRAQKLYFYYEVYEPAVANGEPPLLRTSLAFYRGKVKVFETPIVERANIDVPGRKAAVFQFELPADSLAAGLYTCQINIVDAVSSKFSFPRLNLLVR